MAGDMREGIHNQKNVMAFPFWQLFLLVQSMCCKRGIVIQTVHDCCVRNEKWHRVWRVIISQNDGV